MFAASLGGFVGAGYTAPYLSGIPERNRRGPEHWDYCTSVSTYRRIDAIAQCGVLTDPVPHTHHLVNLVYLGRLGQVCDCDWTAFIPLAAHSQVDVHPSLHWILKPSLLGPLDSLAISI
jgi:hypothetical protein